MLICMYENIINLTYTYKRRLNLLYNDRKIFSFSNSKKYTEQDLVVKPWAPILEATFNDGNLFVDTKMIEYVYLCLRYEKLD